jgi:hypothetical protein
LDAISLSCVQFCIGDIVHPLPAQVLCQLYEKTSLHGEVIAVTDDGVQPGGFLVVKVQGLDEPVIVPAQKVTPDQSQFSKSGQNTPMNWEASG